MSKKIAFLLAAAALMIGALGGARVAAKFTARHLTSQAAIISRTAEATASVALLGLLRAGSTNETMELLNSGWTGR